MKDIKYLDKIKNDKQSKINLNSICKLNITKYNKKITSIKFNYFEYYILYL